MVIKFPVGTVGDVDWSLLPETSRILGEANKRELCEMHLNLSPASCGPLLPLGWFDILMSPGQVLKALSNTLRFHPQDTLSRCFHAPNIRGSVLWAGVMDSLLTRAYVSVQGENCLFILCLFRDRVYMCGKENGICPLNGVLKSWAILMHPPHESSLCSDYPTRYFTHLGAAIDC